MIGAIIGDIVGSVYERRRTKEYDFPLFGRRSEFTDDTVLTIASADAIMTGEDYGEKFREYYRNYPHAGYGGMFIKWANSPRPAPYNSWGNGSAMRVSPVGFAFNDMDRVLHEAGLNAAVTHNHPDGIAGARAIAVAVFMAREGSSKEAIRHWLEKTFGYDLSRRLDDIRPSYGFDVSCRGSVPEAIISFLESDSFEDAIRKAVSLGGDSDTQACIAGAIAQAFYGGVPSDMEDIAMKKLDASLASIVRKFSSAYRC